MKIPDYALKVISLIKDFGYEGRLVGGIVRNFVLATGESTDIDIATTMPANELLSRMAASGISCVPTGLSHGTVTVIIDHMSVEVTTLRRDLQTDGRHAVTKYTSSWFEDSLRRDFTFNAMYMDIDGKIYDYHGGVDDLIAKRIRFIGNPQERIQEDYLRIMRYMRFLTKYAPDFYDESTMQIAQVLAAGLNNISGERIFSELTKTFECDHIFKTLPNFMWLFKRLFNVQKNCFLSKGDFQNMPFKYRLPTLLACNGADVVNYAVKRLRAPNSFKKICNNVSNLLMANDHIEQLLKFKPDERDAYVRVLKIAIPNRALHEVDLLRNVKYEFDITGKDIIQLDNDIDRSKISSIIKNMKSTWLKSHGTLSKSDLLKLK